MSKLFACAMALTLFMSLSCSKDKRKEAAGKELVAQSAKPAPKAEPTVKAAIWYRVVLRKADIPSYVPFFMQVPPKGSGDTAIVRRGVENLAIPIRWTSDSEFVVDFGMLQSELRATVSLDGSLSGTWKLDSGSWGKSEFSLSASQVDAPRSIELFEDSQGEASSVGGVWRVALDESGVGKLELEEKDGSVAGILTFPTANVITLEGEAMGGKLRLSSFDNTSPYLLTATLNDSGQLVDGHWSAGSQMAWNESFSAERTEAFDVHKGPTRIEGKDKLVVPGVDLSKYEGKKVMVEIGGAWCISCRFAAPFLRELYAENHPKGLEFVSLTYEYTDDVEYNTRRAQEFQRGYQIPWEVIPVHGAAADFFDIMPENFKELDVSGFPYAIFVREDGTIMDLHAGFPSAGDKEYYEEVTGEYHELVEKLLAGS